MTGKPFQPDNRKKGENGELLSDLPESLRSKDEIEESVAKADLREDEKTENLLVFPKPVKNLHNNSRFSRNT